MRSSAATKGHPAIARVLNDMGSAYDDTGATRFRLLFDCFSTVFRLTLVYGLEHRSAH